MNTQKAGSKKISKKKQSSKKNYLLIHGRNKGQIHLLYFPPVETQYDVEYSVRTDAGIIEVIKGYLYKKGHSCNILNIL